MENGVRKGFGDIVEITRNDMKTGAYAPYRDNYVKPSTIEDVPTDDNTENDDRKKPTRRKKDILRIDSEGKDSLPD